MTSRYSKFIKNNMQNQNEILQNCGVEKDNDMLYTLEKVGSEEI